MEKKKTTDGMIVDGMASLFSYPVDENGNFLFDVETDELGVTQLSGFDVFGTPSEALDLRSELQENARWADEIGDTELADGYRDTIKDVNAYLHQADAIA